MNPRLKEKYNKEIVQSLMTKLNFKNINAVPKIEKIVLNMGLDAIILTLSPILYLFFSSWAWYFFDLDMTFP